MSGASISPEHVENETQSSDRARYGARAGITCRRVAGKTLVLVAPAHDLADVGTGRLP